MRSCFLLLGLAACGFRDAEGQPLFEAHRGGAGEFPQNSRAALEAAVAASYDAVEFDIQLTQDLEPVISHDPWIDQDLCTTASGGAIETKVYFKDQTLLDLEGYTCGGVEDPEHPDAEVVAGEILSLNEALTILRLADDDMVVHLDVKYDPPHTIDDPNTFCTVILGTWFDALMSNPMYLSGTSPDLIRACEEAATAGGNELETSIIWPHFPIEGSASAAAVVNEIGFQLGSADLISRARRSDADGVLVAWQVADRREIEDAANAGLKVGLWTINETERMEAFSRWPVTSIVTDYPGSAP